MRPEINNDIDLLLQRMARADNAPRNGEARVDDRHLDADELSAYAQNVLPPAARARYTEHLADCVTCRKLVTELSLTLGSAAIAAPVPTAAASGLRKFLASFFSPMVLRYAVPALGVVVVLVVGFVVWRRQTQPEFTAQLRQASRPVADAAASPNTTRTTVDDGALAANSVERSRLKANEKQATPGAAPSGSAGAGPTKTAAAQPKEETAVDKVQPAIAAEAPPPAPKPSATPEVEAQANTVIIKKQPEETKEKSDEAGNARAYTSARDQAVSQPATAAQAENKGQANANAAVSTGSVSSLGGVRPVARRRAEQSKSVDDAKREDAAKDEQTRTADTETQTVAGRRFRKQGKVWIDTSYESSTATVNMARNSDQFRALVADEPAIGTIARQLDGEVIVVWKGRAYRIR